MDAAWEQVGDVLEANRRIRLRAAREGSLASSGTARHLGPVMASSAERGARADGAGAAARHRERRSRSHSAFARSTVPRAALSAPLRRALAARATMSRGARLRDAARAGAACSSASTTARSAPRRRKSRRPTCRRSRRSPASSSPTAVPPALVGLAAPRIRGCQWLLLLVLLAARSSLLARRRHRRGARGRSRPRSASRVRVAACSEQQAAVADAVRAGRLVAGGRSTRCRHSPSFAIARPGRSPRPSRSRAPARTAPRRTRFKTALQGRSPAGRRQREPSGGRRCARRSTSPALADASLRRRSIRDMTVPRLHCSRHRPFPAASRRAQRRGVPRGDGLSGVRHPDVQAAARPSRRALPAEHRPDPAEHDHAARDQPALHRGLHGRASTTSSRASCCGASIPTDQRGSYFRQFWDPSERHRPRGARPRSSCARSCATSRRSTAGRCSRSSAITTIARSPASNEEEVVLVIRGELLKKYPTAVIYAQQAPLAARRRRRRSIHARSAMLETERARSERLRCATPLYEAKVDPDITFFGFDLTVEGGEGRHGPAGQHDDPAGSS